MSSDFVVGLELVAEDAIPKWRSLLGPTNSETARNQAPTSIRAQFGTDGTRNACHGSDSRNLFCFASWCYNKTLFSSEIPFNS
jgi:nucleoside-diphosphate kinase